ncbi:MAG: protein kinase [Bryobacteraceae bacterium]|nr:protein kinase [Bryobacteraceae bacterium]
MEPLKPGDKFVDRYQLLSKLGEGGMGEVWKARDTELDRDVALKVSKAEFTARFKQEARAMAAFNHPNICHIHNVGPNYIVMEFIDGVPLTGPLPVEKAVAQAGLILDALDAAHRKGFTHRDLKPANVMVPKSGVLKLLDFGLAKQQPTGLGPDDVTIQAAITAQGQITGTLQYMSPEQLNGKEADARSDIFAFGCVLYRATRPAALKPLVRLDVDLGPDVSLGRSVPILSPDGARIAWISRNKLFTRRLDQPSAAELAGTEGASLPFFSPDGEWLAFFASGKLKKISVAGGAAVDLSDAGRVASAGGSWGEDGNIIAALGGLSALTRIPSAGGARTPVTNKAPGEAAHRSPQILPGGKAVLFTSFTGTALDMANPANGNIEVVSLADQRRTTLVHGGTFGRYLPASDETGYLVYLNGGTLFAVPFDPGKLEVHGTPTPVLQDVARFDFARNGTLVYIGTGQAQGTLVTVQWLDAAGKTEPLLAKPGLYRYPRLSPDGQRLALFNGQDLSVYEARRDTMTRLASAGPAMAWSPDGRYLAIGGDRNISYLRSDGAGQPQRLLELANASSPYCFTPDGTRLAYTGQVSTVKPYGVSTVRIESDASGLRAGKPENFLQTPADEFGPAFSPDGRWLAYSSNESGKYEVYVRAFPDKGGKWQISNAGGGSPVWSRNGHELLFRNEDNRIMVATYSAKTDSFVPEKPRLWSDKRLADLGPTRGTNFDLAPDGKRVAALVPVETPQQSHVTFLLNFADELQRKVPAGK